MASTVFQRFLLMLISPVLGVAGVLKSDNFAYKRWILTLFITFYGSNIFLSESNDGYVHLSKVYSHYLDLSFEVFIDELYHILTFRPKATTNDDVYIHVLSYFVGSILNAPQLFFVFVSFLYAYFFSGTLLKVFSNINRERIGWIFYCLAVMFFLWKNIEGINTVRTWTGLWILLYATLSYYETKKKKYLVLMVIPPFIHVAYFAMALPAWLVVVFGNRKLVYIAIFLLSFVTTFFTPQRVVGELEQIELGKAAVKGYYIENKEDVFAKKDPSTGTWYYYLMRIGLQKESINLLTVSLILFGVYRIKMSYLEASLFSTGLMTLSLANSSWFLFALANRSAIVGGAFVLMAAVLFFKRGNVEFHRVTSAKAFTFFLFVAIAMMTPFVIYQVADLIRYISLFLLIFPFVPWIFREWNISIREAIGGFL